MKQSILICTLFMAATNGFAQTSYTGFIDKYPIELVTDIYSDGVGRAIYTYTKYDEPIVIDGQLKQKKLVFFEKDKSGKNKATLTFDNFDAKSKQLEGVWKDIMSSKKLKITLTKAFDIDYGYNTVWSKREIIQPVSLKDKYFKLILSKEKDIFNARVVGVKILEKGTDKLMQQIDMDCQLMGLNSIDIGDFNFDGIEDFSVFETSYAGPNTSSLYFLYDPTTKKYINSGFSGTSLEFDNKAKRVFEHNQCCAGTGQMNAEYKVVNNKMVLVKKTCLEYDEKKKDFKTIKCD